eukprot:TRINITY_DN3718_c0_g1_i1.p1 TRINITY_DN3718_c0_g1~~TRINITY_DN3718_c0_g1_i1.p1  ORF type:complete len:928 (-),score=275.03 TRINITY_DN3718_c0_g1_i1:85-2868(-)
MFLVPPCVSYLPSGSARSELLGFGDPYKLRDGIVVTEKKTNNVKVIKSLYDLEPSVKYVVNDSKDVIVTRTSQNRICVCKKKSKMTESTKRPIPSKGERETETEPTSIPRSNPIKIPEWGNSLGKAPLFINTSSADSGTSPSFISQSSESASIGSKASYSQSYENEGFTILKPLSFQHAISIPKSLTSIPSITESSFSPQDNDIALQIEVEIQSPHIPGEKIEKVMEGMILSKSNGKTMRGTLYMSNYQIIFLPYYEQTSQTFPENMRFMKAEVSLPLASIARFEKVDRQNSSVFSFGGENFYALDIFSKEFRRPIRFLLDPSQHQRRDIYNYLMKFVFPQSIENVFAFSSQNRDSESQYNLGWGIYDPEADFDRLGVGKDSKWKRISDNDNYQLCDTYPRLLVVPEKMTEEMLKEVASFRSKGRIPVLTWRNPSTGVTLTRCSQPKTGISLGRSYRCKADEELIKFIQGTNPVHSSKLHIMDARPMANAFANMALGGGYENLNNYPGCELDFMGVANIHVVRDSWYKLRDLCDAASVHHMNVESVDMNGNRVNAPITGTVNWLSQLEATHWLDHLSSIIGGSVRIVQIMDQQKESVLVHCSDGWDRTSQLCSLAQLMVDDYYRTIKGFCILIEKTWLQFGHKFGERLGLNFEDNFYKDVERSPIFLQFIDATWQIMQQFPSCFEFTEELLIVILEHCFSGRFGTFLLDSVKDREEHKIAELSPSIWAFINSDSDRYLNPFWNHTESVLYPNADVNSMILWKSYYFKYFTDSETLTQYENQYVRLGKELVSELSTMGLERDKLAKENAELKKQLEEMKKMSTKQNGIHADLSKAATPFNGTSIGFTPNNAKTSTPPIKVKANTSNWDDDGWIQVQDDPVPHLTPPSLKAFSSHNANNTSSSLNLDFADCSIHNSYHNPGISSHFELT